MGGAFVAVADDASAVFWNPAGLASGAYFTLVLDGNTLQTPEGSDTAHQRSGFLVAAAVPALGLSYYRTRIVRFQAVIPTDGDQSRRNTGGEVRDETLVAQQGGITLLQSLASGLAVGATLKVVHGVASAGVGQASDFVTASRLAESDAATVGGVATNRFDVDLGIMKTGSLGRIGLAVRNLFQPEFAVANGGVPLRLDRRIRAGVSLSVRENTTVAADVDLTTGTATIGPWRDAAVGVETHPSAKAWLRGGVHWNTAGLRDTAASAGQSGAAPVASAGLSYAVWRSAMADAQVSLGSKNGDRGWGVGLRLAF
jgi:hypothetical protein